MGSATHTYETKTLQAWFGSSHASMFPATWYLGLFSIEPSDAGGGTEASGGSYARVGVANDNTHWSVIASAATNLLIVTFPVATGVWGNLPWWGLFDDPLFGALACWGKFNIPVKPVVGARVVLSPGDIQVGAD